MAIKEEDIDHTWLLAEDEARHGRSRELIDLLRHPKGRPLTRGERLVIADILEGKLKKPRHSPGKGSWHSQEADDVARAVGGHRNAGKSEKEAVGLVAKALNYPDPYVRQLELAGRRAHERLQEQAPRVIAEIIKRGYQ